MRRCFALLGVALFLFTACSKDEIDKSASEDLSAQGDLISLHQSNENLTSNFLPTFTNYFGRDWGSSTNKSASLASEWIHEYDEQGQLVKSFFYELYPYRLLKEINYLELLRNKLKFEVTTHNHYGLNYSETVAFEIMLDDNMKITKLGAEVGGDHFISFNEQGWVTMIHAVDDNGGVVYKTGYEYNEAGKVTKYLSFNDSGTNYANVDYTYNENGDPLSYHFQNIYGAEIKVDYFYRADNTLERLEEEFFNDEDDFGTQVFTYTPEETFSTLTTENSDGSSQLVTYSEEEILVEKYQNDVIIEASIFRILETGSVISQLKEYVNGKLRKISYYDEAGELDYTEFYDENGELI